MFTKKIYSIIIPLVILLTSSCSWFEVPPPISIASMAAEPKDLPRLQEVWNHCQAILKDKSLISYENEYEVCKNKIIPSQYDALYIAVLHYNWTAIRYLVEELNVDVNTPPIDNIYKSTPLSLAANKRNNDIIEYLLGKGAHINQEIATTYSTPFQQAIWKKRSDTAILLLERGADPYLGYKSENKIHFFDDVCEHIKYQGMNELLPYLKKCQY